MNKESFHIVVYTHIDMCSSGVGVTLNTNIHVPNTVVDSRSIVSY